MMGCQRQIIIPAADRRSRILFGLMIQLNEGPLRSPQNTGCKIPRFIST